jgi:hypothetical protein
VPLAYLDTSHLHLLATERLKESTDFAEFIAAWRRGGWELALSLFHHIEGARYGSADGRAARYALLRHLAPLWSTLPVRTQVQGGTNLTRREIRHALAVAGLASPVQTIPGSRGLVFVERVEPQDVAAVQALEDGELRQYVQLFHDAVSLAAEASRRPPRTKPSEKKLRDIENNIPLPKDVQAIRDAVDRELSRSFAGIGRQLPAAARDQALARVRGCLDTFLNSALKDGVQMALTQVLSSAGAEVSVRAPIPVLVHEHVFADEVRRTLQEDIKVTDEGIILQAVKAVKLQDCPGTWLSREVSRSLTAAEHAPEAGSTYDLEHLGYVPYVDLLFSDKRIAEFTRQVLRRGDLPTTLSGVRPPRAIPNSVDAIRSALEENAP